MGHETISLGTVSRRTTGRTRTVGGGVGGPAHAAQPIEHDRSNRTVRIGASLAERPPAAVTGLAQGLDLLAMLAVELFQVRDPPAIGRVQLADQTAVSLGGGLDGGGSLLDADPRRGKLLATQPPLLYRPDRTRSDQRDHAEGQ